MKLLERILSNTDLSIEQKTAVRGMIRIMKEEFVSMLKSTALFAPLVFAFMLYGRNIEQATFWAVISIVGYMLFRESNN